MFRRPENRVVGVGIGAAVLVGFTVGMWVSPARRDGRGSLGMQAEARPVSTPAALSRLGEAFASIAEAVTPAVVNINTARIVRRRGLFSDPFFSEFFGERGPWERRAPERRSQSLGSGVIISESGHVVTNYHVIEGADEITVVVPDNGAHAARLVGSDPATDLAVVRIAGTHLPHVEWGDSEKLRVGEWVVAVGSPFGLSQTVTAGIVSAKGRADTGMSDYAEFIQTDAAINPGNSGGALVNVAGELVGINTAIFSESGGYDGIGFAIPADIAGKITLDLIRSGEVVRGFIGIFVKPVTDQLAPQLGLNRAQGVVVDNLYRNSPAEAAGFDLADVIVEFGGKKIESPRELRKAVAESKVDSSVPVRVIRRGKETKLTVEIMKQPSDRSGRPIAGI